MTSGGRLPLPTTPTGLRERRKIATRRAISGAALRLALERGLENVLIEDIAEEAGVALRTFRNYFANKYEAICAANGDRALRIADTLRRRPPSEPLWDAICEAVCGHYEGADSAPDRGSIEALRLVTRSPAMRGEYLKVNVATQRTLADAIAERIGADPDPDRDMLPTIVAGAVVTASQTALRRWVDADPPVPLRPLLRDALGRLPEVFARALDHGRSGDAAAGAPAGGSRPIRGSGPPR